MSRCSEDGQKGTILINEADEESLCGDVLFMGLLSCFRRGRQPETALPGDSGSA